MSYEQLIKAALEARGSSYSPYSHFAVGAALLGRSGKVYLGSNIENAGYSASNCAERTAFFSAVQQGERRFDSIAIVGGPAGEEPSRLCPPCGVCRQVMREFCSPDDFTVILAVSPDDYEVLKLKDLLPRSFGPEDLE